MTRDEAIAFLAATPTCPYVYFVHPDATLSHWIEKICHLDDGELVHAHPTDPQRGPVSAPESVRYWRPSDERLAEEDKAWEQLCREEAAEAERVQHEQDEIYG